jgi:catalase-peroxidase
LKKILVIYEKIAREFSVGEKFVSVADLTVLGGDLGIEIAAKRAGHDVVVPFKQGRMDATQEETDVKSINFLEPRVDGFRNYIHG